MNRRDFLRAAGLATGAVLLGRTYDAHAAPQIEVLETKSINQYPQYYHGWPTVAANRKGKLFLVYSGGREQHVCPFGRVELMVSNDSGATWSWPQVLLDGPIDDRDAGILVTAMGTLLVTSFTSLAYESNLEKLRSGTSERSERLAAWEAAHNRVSAEQRKSELGTWMLRSTDDGVTWSTRYSTIVNSPHGPIQLDDGRLLYPGIELWTKARRLGVCESPDDGRSWKWLAAIPARPGDNPRDYHELHGIQTSNSRIIVHIRNHNSANNQETLQTESSDGGRTWSVPHTIGVWGLPSFLSKLRDGTLLMTYGHRRPPFGNQARLSTDEGRTWSDPLIISGDGKDGDLGYPSTVELQDKTLLTVWYEATKGSPKTVLRQARWRLKV